jgi:vacuolar-type H+-ATPase subunit I/STV1
MKPGLLILLLLLTGMTACKSKSAFAYSEAIVKIQRTLDPGIIATENQFSDFLTKGNYDSAAAVSGRMESLVDSKLKEVEKLETPNVKEADNFRRAVIRYFSYLKSIYTAYKRYAIQTNDEDREAERLKLLRVIDDKEEAIEDIQKAQAKYAQANGFRIDHTK